LAYLLVLAGENLGRLQHVGQVTPQLPLDQLRALSQQLAALQTHEPFLPMQMENIVWVKPVVACRVSYARKGKKGGLYETKLESLLGDLADPLAPAAKPGTPEKK
jgi:ATP-dependent DNA ligase